MKNTFFQFIKTRFTKEYWERGNGEVLGFLVTMPIILIIASYFVGMVQVAQVRERLEYTAYVACRAAATQENLRTARTVAENAAKTDLLSVNHLINSSTLKTTLAVVDATGRSRRTIRTNASTVSQASRTRTNWKKGNYVSCTVTAEMHSYIPVFNGEKQATITMMIEKPTDFGLDNFAEIRQ